MFKDFIVIDNVFENPSEILDFAKRQTFLPPPRDQYWTGLRTEPIHTIDEDLFFKICNNVLSHSLGATLKDSKFGYSYNMNCYLHKMCENDKPQNDWWHTDQHLFAGVIYLSENAPLDCGTSLNIDGTIVTVENKFNRMVMYRSSIHHCASRGYGDYERLTIPFGVNSLTVSYIHE